MTFLGTSVGSTDTRCPRTGSGADKDWGCLLTLSNVEGFCEAMGGEISGAGLFSDSSVSKLGMTTDTESMVLMLSLLLLLVIVVASDSDTPFTVVTFTLVVIGTLVQTALLEALLDFFSFLLFDLGFGVFTGSDTLGLGVFRDSLGGEGLLGVGVKNKVSRALADRAIDIHADISGVISGDEAETVEFEADTEAALFLLLFRFLDFASTLEEAGGLSA